MTIPQRDPIGTAPAAPAAAKTLAELVADLRARLGFVALQSVSTGRTLAQVRADLTQRLGFIAPNAVVSGKTLEALRTYLLTRLGFAAQTANPPPGMLGLLDAFVNEAQETLWRRYGQQVTPGFAPPALVSPTDVLTLDNRAVEMLALGMAKSHYGQPDAQIALQQFETYLTELIQRQPPGLNATLDRIINDAQQTLWRRYEQAGTGSAPPLLTQDNSPLTMDDQAVTLLAVGLAKAHYGQPDAKSAQDAFEVYLRDLARRSPPDAESVLRGMLQEAQNTLFQRFEWPELLKWYTLTTVVGQSLYTAFTALGTDVPDPHRIVEARIEDAGTMFPLRYGIDGGKYTAIEPGLPVRYEFRAGLELWPPPDKATYVVHVKAISKLHRFTVDTDPVTLPATVVALEALAKAKRHYGQRDADDIERQADIQRRHLAARAHGTQRYVPGPGIPDPLPQPIRV